MRGTLAARMALDVLHMPGRIHGLRAVPLPDDVDMLLRIVGGDAAATAAIAGEIQRAPDEVVEAAEFYIEQVMLLDADHYRALGASPQSSTAELRRHMALLMGWLHPDHNPRPQRAALARRVILAWNTLKTPGQRAAYDGIRQSEPAQRPLLSRAKRKRAISSGAGRHLRSSSLWDRLFDPHASEAPHLLRRALALLARGPRRS